MPYIRTKDNIYEISEYQSDFLKKEDYGNVTTLGLGDYQNSLIGKGKYVSIKIADIKTQSDDLRELFDEFIWVNSIINFKDNLNFYFENDDFIFSLDEYKIKDGIYGAIWITGEHGEPILKSIAQMNLDYNFELFNKVEE